MLPSRGLARGPASALRYSSFARSKPAGIASTRQFSLSQSQSSALSRHGFLRANTSQYAQRTPSIAAVGITSSVFAQRSAGRNFSLWPFQSKTQTPQNTDTLEKPLAEAPPAETPPAEAQTSITPPDVASETAAPAPSPPPAGANEGGMSDLPDHLLHQFDSPSLFDVPVEFGYLKTLGLDFGWGPTSCCQWLLEHIHVVGGLPWWGSIAAVALLFRLVIFYPALRGSQEQAKLQKVQASSAYVNAKVRFTEGLQASDRATMMAGRAEMKILEKQANISKVLLFSNVAMVPFSFGMFRLLRNMSMIPVPGLETGGLAWFTDLTVCDPLYILPTISAALTYVVLKQTQRLNLANPLITDAQMKMTKVMAVILPPIMFLTTWWLAAGIQWFLLLMSAGALTQTLATLNPTIRRWMQLPWIPDGPRGVIKGTAHEVNYQSPTRTGLVDSLKDSMTAATDAMKQVAGATPERAQQKRVKEYEERRAEEERQNLARRMEEIRRRRTGKQ
ncbi:hypothetical protein F4861DRAFT_513758 [Xylaria intraflava]|nr:hypothetical protein F4861DRAFT_513758 [Xylaria intraflava]